MIDNSTTINNQEKLDIKIDSRTEHKAMANILEDMQEDKKRLEEQRIAILNILEDVNESQIELKKKYSDLEIIKSLTQSLGSSMELESVMDNVARSIHQIFPSLIISYCLSPLESNYLANKISIYSNCFLEDSYLKQIEESVINAIKQNIDIKGAQKNLKKLEKIKFSYKILEFDKFLFDSKKKSRILVSSTNVLIIASDKLIGAVNFSSDKGFSFGKKEMSVINTIVNSASQTIERLRILVSSEQSRLNSLVESMSNGVLMFDLKENIVIANPVIKKIIEMNNFSLNDFFKTIKNVEKSFGEVINKEKKINIANEISNAINKDETISFDEVEIRKRTFEIFITPIKDYKQEITGGAIILHDITHLKEINRMKSEFVSVASHQLRTPLTSIRLFIEMLERGDVGSLNNDQKEYISNVSQSTKSMIQLVNDLLNLSRIESGKLKINLQSVQLDNLVQEIITEASVLAKEKKCNIIFNKKECNMPLVSTDANLLRQVIHNLITNAIRYSLPDKCGIVIKIKKGQDLYTVSVTDSGIGMPKEVQNRIFDKFFRADNAVKTSTDGSGLGLYVAKMIIERLDGKIWFDSKEGEGTTFYVEVPTGAAIGHISS